MSCGRVFDLIPETGDALRKQKFIVVVPDDTVVVFSYIHIPLVHAGVFQFFRFVREVPHEYPTVRFADPIHLADRFVGILTMVERVAAVDDVETFVFVSEGLH